MLPLTAPVFHPSSGFIGAALKFDCCRWRGTRLDLAIGILTLRGYLDKNEERVLFDRDCYDSKNEGGMDVVVQRLLSR